MSERSHWQEINELEAKLVAAEACAERMEAERDAVAGRLEKALKLGAENRERAERAEAALREVEAWWLETGKYAFTGAPYAMFEVRAILAEKETGRE